MLLIAPNSSPLPRRGILKSILADLGADFTLTERERKSKSVWDFAVLLTLTQQAALLADT